MSESQYWIWILNLGVGFKAMFISQACGAAVGSGCGIEIMQLNGKSKVVVRLSDRQIALLYSIVEPGSFILLWDAAKLCSSAGENTSYIVKSEGLLVFSVTGAVNPVQKSAEVELRIPHSDSSLSLSHCIILGK